MRCEWCEAEMGDDPRWPYCPECVEQAAVELDEHGAGHLVPGNSE